MGNKLEKYNEKRNFDKTFEPEGMVEDNDKGLRFVVQHHMASREHYDLRLEWKGVLLSWAVPKGPSYNTRDKRLAVHVEDHPLSYRNFEGTIPKNQYGGGIVMIWDEGFWEPRGNVEEGRQKGEIKFILKGRRLKGKWTIVRWKAKFNEKTDHWLLIKEKDDYVKSEDGISEFTTSVITGRTMAEIEAGEDEKMKKNPFNRVNVQLAKPAHTEPEGEDWLCELKYDGFRILAFVEGNRARLITRNTNDYSDKFPNVTAALADFTEGRAMVLDGEIVVIDESGKTDFQGLQNYLKKPQSQNLKYIIFDILALDGIDLREKSLMDRKNILEALMKDAPPNLYYSSYIKGHVKESFHAACELNMEGIIVKKADAIYSGTRNGDWLKLKCDKIQEFVIGGYSLTEKKTSGVSALLLGFYEGNELIYAGRAGSGISVNDMSILEEKFQNLKRPSSPFQTPPSPRPKEMVTWVEPEVVAEIKFSQWTKDHLLRHGIYKGLKPGKNPKKISNEKIEDPIHPPTPTDIKITNPDKILYDDPKITKEDVVNYYKKVSKRMLPYVGHRILSVVRCPKGINQPCFFKKRPGPNSKGIATVPVAKSSGETEDYFYIDHGLGLVSEAQMGTLEFHIWGSKVQELEKPDMMVFDLDPDEGMDLSKVRQGVEDVRSILRELSLNAYLKTSGGKGYHVVVPLAPSVTWDDFHDFAKRLVEVMEKKWPDRYTSNVRKSNRKGKIFIDWIRNGRGATSIAPYSLRARVGAKVSMPISWEELYTVPPDGIDIFEALERIDKKDPWKDFFKNEQKLK